MFEQEIIKYSNDAIISMDKDDTVMSWNTGAEKIFGWAASEIIGEKIYRIIPAEFHSAHKAGRERATQGIYNIMGNTVEVKGLHKSGEVFPIELTLSTWKEGDAVFFGGIIRDISARHKNLMAIKAAEERFKAITEYSADAIISIDKTNKILSWNRGAEKLFAYEREDILGKDITLIIPEKFRDKHNAGIKRFIETGMPSVMGRAVELTALRKDQTEFPIELTLSTWRHNNESFFAGIIRDISGRKEIEKSLENERKLLQIEKDRAENLLLNILPFAIAKELSYTGKVETRQYEKVTVMFADFVGFSRIAKTLDGRALVEELDACFKKFDKVIEKYRLEKIKTIGDAYMAAAGVPEDNQGCPVDVIMAAIEMREFVRRRNAKRMADKQWKLRIGINTGPVIAGVVGSKKFVSDIWGDAVNLASRIESSARPGSITISETTRQLVEDLFEFELIGSVDLKNIGAFDTHRLLRFKPQYSVDGDGKSPNGMFLSKCSEMGKCQGVKCAVSDVLAGLAK